MQEQLAGVWFLVWLPVLVAFAAAPAVAEVYRWEDEDGQVHFSDEPPAGQDRGERLDPPRINSVKPVKTPNLEPFAEDQRKRVRRVIVKRANNGHFAARGEINGAAVTFLFDTGSSHVSIPQAVAQRIGLERGEEVRYNTANGVAEGYLTNLDEVSVGKIAVDDVRGSINPNVDHDVVLLGMSFLGQLEFSQRNNQLILRQVVAR